MWVLFIVKSNNFSHILLLFVPCDPPLYRVVSVVFQLRYVCGQGDVLCYVCGQGDVLCYVRGQGDVLCYVCGQGDVLCYVRGQGNVLCYVCGQGDVLCYVCGQGDVLRYELVDGEDSDVFRELFWINSQTGVIIARKSLSHASRDRYQVLMLLYYNTLKRM